VHAAAASSGGGEASENGGEGREVCAAWVDCDRSTAHAPPVDWDCAAPPSRAPSETPTNLVETSEAAARREGAEHRESAELLAIDQQREQTKT
jgi:hypothetical protein